MAERNITFDQIPSVLGTVLDTLEEIKTRLPDATRPAEQPDELMDVKQLCAYLSDHPAVQTVYGWTSTNKIPHENAGKYLRFRKSLIDAWDAAGRPYVDDAADQAAEEYVNRKFMESL